MQKNFYPQHWSFEKNQIHCNFDKSIAFKASLDLVLEGDISPSGYTEPILHKSRLQLKSMPD